MFERSGFSHCWFDVSRPVGFVSSSMPATKQWWFLLCFGSHPGLANCTGASIEGVIVARWTGCSSKLCLSLPKPKSSFWAACHGYTWPLSLGHTKLQFLRMGWDELDLPIQKQMLHKPYKTMKSLFVRTRWLRELWLSWPYLHPWSAQISTADKVSLSFLPFAAHDGCYSKGGYTSNCKLWDSNELPWSRMVLNRVLFSAQKVEAAQVVESLQSCPIEIHMVCVGDPDLCFSHCWFAHMVDARPVGFVFKFHAHATKLRNWFCLSWNCHTWPGC